MRSGVLTRALAAAALLAALAAGCGRPDDETWLQFLGFRKSWTTTTYLAVLEGYLTDGETDSADAVFQNTSYLVGVSGSGSGVLIHRARVEYRMPDLQPPAWEIPLHLYLPAPSHTSGSTGTTTPTTGTITGFPLATAELKSWIIGTGAYTNRPRVSLEADVTFFAETDEGTDLETTGAISIELLND